MAGLSLCVSIFRTPELDAEFAQHKENSLILLASRWGAPEIETLPGVARFARSPLANLLARLRRALEFGHFFVVWGQINRIYVSNFAFRFRTW